MIAHLIVKPYFWLHFFVIETQEYNKGTVGALLCVYLYDWPPALLLTWNALIYGFPQFFVKTNSVAPIIIISLCASALLKRRSSAAGNCKNIGPNVANFYAVNERIIKKYSELFTKSAHALFSNDILFFSYLRWPWLF